MGVVREGKVDDKIGFGRKHEDDGVEAEVAVEVDASLIRVMLNEQAERSTEVVKLSSWWCDTSSPS